MKHESTCGSIAWSRAQSGRCREAAFNVWEHGGADGRRPLFVPEITKISEVLRTLQRQRQDMALVVDEYGNVVGLIAIRDIVEGHLQAYGHEQRRHRAGPDPRLSRLAPAS